MAFDSVVRLNRKRNKISYLLKPEWERLHVKPDIQQLKKNYKQPNFTRVMILEHPSRGSTAHLRSATVDPWNSLTSCMNYFQLSVYIISLNQRQKRLQIVSLSVPVLCARPPLNAPISRDTYVTRATCLTVTRMNASDVPVGVLRVLILRLVARHVESIFLYLTLILIICFIIDQTSWKGIWSMVRGDTQKMPHIGNYCIQLKKCKSRKNFLSYGLFRWRKGRFGSSNIFRMKLAGGSKHLRYCRFSIW